MEGNTLHAGGGENTDNEMGGGNKGVLDSVINQLPDDLIEFVGKDNIAFDEERRKWDVDQENQRIKQAELQKKLQQAGNGEKDDMEITVLQDSTPGNDVEVRKTYIMLFCRRKMQNVFDLPGYRGKVDIRQPSREYCKANNYGRLQETDDRTGVIRWSTFRGAGC